MEAEEETSSETLRPASRSYVQRSDLSQTQWKSKVTPELSSDLHRHAVVLTHTQTQNMSITKHDLPVSPNTQMSRQQDPEVNTILACIAKPSLGKFGRRN